MVGALNQNQLIHCVTSRQPSAPAGPSGRAPASPPPITVQRENSFPTTTGSRPSRLAAPASPAWRRPLRGSGRGSGAPAGRAPAGHVREPTSSLLYASKKLKQYHKKEREIRVAAEATNGLGEAPSLAFIETDLAALMLSDPAKLGVKL